MASRETRTRQRIKLALENDGHVVITLRGDATSGAGRTDLVICARGLFFGMEVKTPEGKPSPFQIRNILRIRQSGGCAALVHDIDEARRMIRLRLQGRIPYLENELVLIDLSDMNLGPAVVVEEPEDPNVIPFPSVPEAAPDGDHQVAVLVLSPPPAPPPAPPAPPTSPPKPARTSRAKATAKTPEPTPIQEVASADPLALPTSTGEIGLAQVYDRLMSVWDKVNGVELLLREELVLIEKFLPPPEDPLTP